MILNYSPKKNQDFVLKNAGKREIVAVIKPTEKNEIYKSLVETNAISVVVIVEGVLLRRSSVFFRVCSFSFCLQGTAKRNTVSKCQISIWQPLNRVGQCLPAKNGINSGARRNTIGGAESSDDHVIWQEEMEEDGRRTGEIQVGHNSLHTLLGPFKVALGLAGDFDAL